MKSYLVTKDAVPEWTGSDGLRCMHSLMQLNDTLEGLVESTHCIYECTPWAFIVNCSRDATVEELDAIKNVIGSAMHIDVPISQAGGVDA